MREAGGFKKKDEAGRGNYFFSADYQQHSQVALKVAIETTPVYRPWQPRDPGPAVTADARYAALPILTKQDLRAGFPQGLVPAGRSVAEGLQRGEIEYVHTSGTTSEKVTNLWNQSWWNASEIASWKLNAHTTHLDGTQREAQLASALSVGMPSADDLPMSSRRLGRFLFLNEKTSARDWTARHCQRMAEELEAYRPAVLEANPSWLARLAWWALDHGLRLYQPGIILFTYEFISAVHLQSIRKVFKVPLASSYGATETGYVFMECEHGTLHQNTEFCRVDFQPLNPKHGGPDLGRLLVTTFGNPWTSLLRFDVGDLARLDNRPACPCGRNLGYRLKAIEGRAANATFTVSGKLVTTHQLDQALARLAGVRDYQLVQESPQAYVLALVPSPGASPALAQEAEETLSALYGPGAKINIRLCVDIEPAASGKYRRTSVHFSHDPEALFL